MFLDLNALGHRCSPQLKGNVTHSPSLSPRALPLTGQGRHPQSHSSMSARNSLSNVEHHPAMTAPKYTPRCDSKIAAALTSSNSVLDRGDGIHVAKACDAAKDHHSPVAGTSTGHAPVMMMTMPMSPTTSRPSVATHAIRQVNSPVSPVSPPFPSPATLRSTPAPRQVTTQTAAGPEEKAPKQPALVVFSGGTAMNSVAGHLRRLTTRVTHVLPVSDDGGSTAEVVRVLGGPAVGDIRSRCLRLADSNDTEGKAVKALLAHRLPAGDPAAAKHEWYQLVEGEHHLWQGVSEPYKHVIRAYLVHFHHQILAHASVRFNFSNGSIGNFFFAGARTFFRSLEAAIFLFSRVARIPEGCIVTPAICTEERITLGAELEDGSVIRGQNNISHPPVAGEGVWKVEKSDQVALPSPIRRVFYLSSHSYDQSDGGSGASGGLPRAYSPGPGGLASSGSSGMELEVLPQAHPTAVVEVGKADAIIFGCGSLYTSICPTICLEGMGEAVASRHVHKIMVLNGTHDRETSRCGAHDGPMTAADMVQAVCDALNRRRNRQGSRLLHPPGSYVTGLLYPEGGEVAVDVQALRFLGVRHVLEVRSQRDSSGRVVYDPHHLVEQIGACIALPLDTNSNSTAGGTAPTDQD